MVWLIGLGFVLLVRFPGNFLLHPPFLMDFDLFHTIAQRVVGHDAIHLYDSANTQQALFKYAPCWALFFAPLGWFSSHAGAVLWSSLTVAWLLLACGVSDRLSRILGLHPPRFLAILVVLILVRPITSEFLLGQTNVLWGLLVASAWLCHMTKRPWCSAISLALAISLKLPALIVLVYLMLRGQWPSTARTVVSVVLMNALAAWLLVPHDPGYLFVSWARVLLISGPDRAFEIGNQSFLALTGRFTRQDGYGFNLLMLPDPIVMILAVVLQLVLFGSLFVPHARRLPGPTRDLLDGALLMVWMVLFSPTCWIATYSALLPPLFIVLAVLNERPRITWWRSAPLAAGVMATGILSAFTHSNLWRFLGIHHIKGESYAYLVVMIFPWMGLALAWSLWHQRQLMAQRLRG